MKKAGTCLNFEDDTVTMLKKKIPLSCTSSGHYYIPITRPLPDKRKFKHVPFIKEISSKNTAKKLKLQQSYIDNLVILVVRNCVTQLKMQE